MTGPAVSKMHVTAIIAGGGRGLRFGGDLPKQLVVVGGRAILERSVASFLAHPHVNELVVALPADLLANPPAYLCGASKPLRLVEGGARRQDSVANAFAAASARTELVVVHDAARPFASAGLIARTIAAAAEDGAAIAAVASRDTVKLASRAGAGREQSLFVGETLAREAVFLAQTPQAFRPDVLRRALAQDVDATDEAALAERAGHRVRIVEGEAANIKITTPADLPLAEAIARGQAGSAPPSTTRIGTGYDLHRLVAGRRLIVGGVELPSDRGALGHSDADVVCHAVTDAILGAAALGDIGRHFPDSDDRWKDASSLDLLAHAAAIAAEHGYEVVNVDATVVLELPKIKDHIEAMRRALAEAIGVQPSHVSVKGKTNEGVDAPGRGEAIAAHAVALVRVK